MNFWILVFTDLARTSWGDMAREEQGVRHHDTAAQRSKLALQEGRRRSHRN